MLLRPFVFLLISCFVYNKSENSETIKRDFYEWQIKVALLNWQAV